MPFLASNPHAPGGSEMNRQRAKLAMKAGVPGVASPVPSRPSTRPVVEEKFLPPKMSMVSIFDMNRCRIEQGEKGG